MTRSRPRRPWQSARRQPRVTFKLLTGRNLRTAPFLKRALPWTWEAGRSAVDSLADAYERHLTSLRLPDVPERPAFIFSSTDTSYGVNSIFS